MNDEKSISWKKLQEKWLTRRSLIRGAAGTAAGAGFLLGSGLRLPARAGTDDEGERRKCKSVPRPIPHISTPPGGHFFFPGPVDADPTTSPNKGHDPSIITDFKGTIGQADLNFSGIGTDLNTGASATYDFHCDMRFMNGVFVGLDNEQHRGAIGFIWLDSLGVTSATPHGSPLGVHSYDPGIGAGSLVLWGAPYPVGSGNVDTDSGTAELQVHNICVFDVFTVPNSFDPKHTLGIFGAVINSMRIEWSGVTRNVPGFSDTTNKFRGDFFECSATIAVSATTPKDTGQGFHFESDPATTHTNFAQFGREHNGMFF